MIQLLINELVAYGISKELVETADEVYVTNRLMEILRCQEFEKILIEHVRPIHEILDDILKYAIRENLLEEDTVSAKDLFDTKVMGALTPPPSVVQRKFAEKYSKSSKAATDFYFAFSQSTNYIRNDRIAKDEKWIVETEYGPIDITINLSKPEKDPRDIARARQVKSSSYPRCLLCKENEGYAGHLGHPARQNHRIIPLEINGSQWGFQYSPYVYYNEHCIVFHGEHTPMKIERATFVKLFDFIKQFPHYFLGSNADLPIVGGSILSHDHFQGGCYQFAMEKAPIEKHFTIPGYEDVESGIVKWPLSVLRFRSKDERRLIDLADHVLHKWRSYTDKTAFLFAETDGEPHNTITPIARMSGEMFELDLALRNNITTTEHPLGVYHPHAEYHHIKKENIGLIEVMGLAVLPARLKGELQLLAEYICEKKDIASNEHIEKHNEWIKKIMMKHPVINRDNVKEILQKEVGEIFVRALEDAGVFKRTEEGKKAFERFISVL